MHTSLLRGWEMRVGQLRKKAAFEDCACFFVVGSFAGDLRYKCMNSRLQ